MAKNRRTFTEVITKLKQGYHFLEHHVQLNTEQQSQNLLSFVSMTFDLFEHHQ